MSDVMLFGVLKMPYELAMSTELSRRQFYDRVQELVARFEAEQLAQQDNPHPEYCKGYAAGLEAGAISEKKSVQQQEPVAWRWKMSLIPDAWQLSDQPHPEAALKEALYPSPPASKPWVGLTSEEKKEIERLSIYVEGAIRHTEAKLREKNNG